MEQLTSLMELYVANNQVSDAKEVHNLRNVAKLLILDFSGNPLTSAEDYRLYTIFHLKVSGAACLLQALRSHFPPFLPFLVLLCSCLVVYGPLHFTKSIVAFTLCSIHITHRSPPRRPQKLKVLDGVGIDSAEQQAGV